MSLTGSKKTHFQSTWNWPNLLKPVQMHACKLKPRYEFCVKSKLGGHGLNYFWSVRKWTFLEFKSGRSWNKKAKSPEILQWMVLESKGQLVSVSGRSICSSRDWRIVGPSTFDYQASRPWDSKTIHFDSRTVHFPPLKILSQIVFSNTSRRQTRLWKSIFRTVYFWPCRPSTFDNLIHLFKTEKSIQLLQFRFI